MGLITLEMESGALGTIEVSKVATGSNDELRLRSMAGEGAVRYNQMKANWLSVYDARDPESSPRGKPGVEAVDCPAGTTRRAINSRPEGSIGWLRPHVHCLYHFLDALAADRPTDPDLKRGIYVQKLLHLAYQSAETRNG